MTSCSGLGLLLLGAAKRGHLEDIKHLVSQGAIFTTDSLGMTALHYTAQHGMSDGVQFLLKSGADSSACSKVGRTALHLAAEAGHEDIVQILLNNNRHNIDYMDMLGMTALHWAVEKGHVKVIETLLKFSPDVTIKNKFSRTSVDLAVSSGQTDLIDTLRQYQQSLSCHGATEVKNTSRVSSATLSESHKRQVSDCTDEHVKKRTRISQSVLDSNTVETQPVSDTSTIQTQPSMNVNTTTSQWALNSRARSFPCARMKRGSSVVVITLDNKTASSPKQCGYKKCSDGSLNSLNTSLNSTNPSISTRSVIEENLKSVATDSVTQQTRRVLSANGSTVVFRNPVSIVQRNGVAVNSEHQEASVSVTGSSSSSADDTLSWLSTYGMSLMSGESSCLVTRALNRGQHFALTEAGKLVMEQMEQVKRAKQESATPTTENS